MQENQGAPAPTAAVLFMIFNRPVPTARVFETIRAARPPRLYIAADGPREGVPQDIELCRQTRELTETVDWPCTVTRLYPAENRGCRLGCSSAVSWFFRHEEEGIILEDDTLAQPSFFPYCSELLERYRHDDRVMHVGSNNFQLGRVRGEGSYYFSLHNHMWGWATWRRAWRHYDLDMSLLPAYLEQNRIEEVLELPEVRRFWLYQFVMSHNGEINSWDYQWTFAIWQRGGVAITPNCNLVSNIGFGPDAVHCQKADSVFANRTSQPIAFPLRHPESRELDRAADDFTFDYVFLGKTNVESIPEVVPAQSPAGACGSCGTDDPEFRELLATIRPYTALSEQRLFSLYSLARQACAGDLPGNFVECGVAAGGSSALLAFVIKKYSKLPRRLFSFDPFPETPTPPAPGSQQGIAAESAGRGTGSRAASEQSLQEVCAKLGVCEVVTTVKGAFEQTLPELRDWAGMVALLHLDGDSYHPAQTVLENLYDRLVNGALLQVDDYGCRAGCHRAIREFEAARGTSFTLNQIDGTGVWFAKPDGFPVNRALAGQLIEDFRLDDPVPKGVTSQMSANERFQLYYAVRREIPATPGLVRFIEIGSYSGASLLLTHQALQRMGLTFQGICVEPGGTDQFHEIAKLLAEDVIHLPLFSHVAAGRLAHMVEPERLPQFIFVDGDHSYQGVRQDILDFYPLLAPGGVMLFHDYLPPLDDANRAFILQHHGGAEPGIRQACQELMEEAYGCQLIELPLLFPEDPTQTQPQLPIIPGVFSTVRAYRKPAC